MTTQRVTSQPDRLDLQLFLEVYMANGEFGMPYMPSPSKFNRAKRLCELGWLKDAKVEFSPPHPKWAAFQVTKTGIEGYNATLGKAA